MVKLLTTFRQSCHNKSFHVEPVAKENTKAISLILPILSGSLFVTPPTCVEAHLAGKSDIPINVEKFFSEVDLIGRRTVS